MSEVTRILEAIDKGEPRAAEQLLPLVYEELRKLAASKMSREPPGQTLQPTALVHEAWLRLAGNENQPENQRWKDRAHFFGAAAEAMRRILIDNARRKLARRHGSGQARLDVDELEIAAPGSDDQVLVINEALEKLASLDAQKAQLVKLRYFAGLTIEQAAQVLGISEATAKRWWSFCRAWLYTEINDEQKRPGRD